MSKTLGNIVEPMPIVERWGADSMRLIMLFAGPFEDDIDWKLIAGDRERRPGVHAWLGRVLTAAEEAVMTDAPDPDSLVKITHQTIKGVTEDLDRFRFNVAISKLMVLSNEIRSALDAGAGAREAVSALAQMLAPVAPFMAEELWRAVLGNETSVHVSSWPDYDPALVAEDTVTLIVQVDGKLRDKLEVPVDADDGALLELARASERAQRALDGRTVIREIVRAPKLVNFVTRS